MVKSKRNNKNKQKSDEADVKPDLKIEVKEEEMEHKPIVADSQKGVKKPKKQVKDDKSLVKSEFKRYFNKSRRVRREKAPRGVVYVSSLPHGFYEKQLEGYFGQFGKVTGVYVPKSKKTGRAKGYAFVEYLHPEVAEIAADTMNNYLMFNRLIKTKLVPPEKQRPYMFSDHCKELKHQYSDKAVTKTIKKRRSVIAKKRDSCVTRSVRKLARLQDSMKLMGVDYKIKVAGLHDNVTLTSIRAIDAENQPKEIKQEEPDSKESLVSSKKKKGKKTSTSKIAPMPSAEENKETAVALVSKSAPKRGSVKSIAKSIAKQQIASGKEKVAKLVKKTIGKSKIKTQKTNLKKTVQNLPTEDKKKIKKVTPSTSKQLDSSPPRKPASSPAKKKRSVRSKLETTV